MASITLLGTQTFNTTSGTHTVVATPALGDYIAIVVANTGNTANVAPTDNNADGEGQYDRVNTCVKASSADTMQMWVRRSAIGSATSTTFTHAPGTSSGGGLGVFKITSMRRYGLSGVRQSAIQSNQSAGGTPTPVLGSSALTTNCLIGAVFNATSPATMTPRSSPAWTENFDVGYSTPTTGLETMSVNSGETATSIAWGSTSGSAFCSLVAEFDTSVWPAVDDTESDYSGFGQTMSRVAGVILSTVLATAIQAQTVINTQYDDVLFPPLPAGAAVSRPTAKIWQWFAGDEAPHAPAPFVEEDLSGPLFSIPNTVRFQLDQPDSDYVYPAGSIHVDEDYWQQPYSVAPVVVTFVATSDEQIIPHVDEDYWQPSYSLSPVVVTFVSTSDEQVVPQVTFQLEEERASDPVWLPVEPNVIIWATDDDVAPQAAPTLSGSAPRSPNANIWRWGVQDEVPQAAAPFRPDEDYWQQWTPSSIAAIQQPILAQDEIERIGFDEESWQPSSAVGASFQWTPWDQEFVAPTTLGVDEEPWQPSAYPLAPFIWQPWEQDFPQQAPPTLGVDEDVVQLFLPDPFSVTQVVWADSGTQLPILGMDEEVWQPSWIFLQSTPQQPIWSDDFAQTSQVPLHVDEQDWIPVWLPAQIGVQFPLWADDFVPPPAPLPIDEQDWLQPLSASPIVKAFIQMWEEIDFVAPPAPQFAVETDWLPSTFPAAAPFIQMWEDPSQPTFSQPLIRFIMIINE